MTGTNTEKVFAFEPDVGADGFRSQVGNVPLAGSALAPLKARRVYEQIAVYWRLYEFMLVLSNVVRVYKDAESRAGPSAARPCPAPAVPGTLETSPALSPAP